MKVLLLAALATFSFSSMATSLVGDFPKVQFGSVFVSVEEVCVSGSNVKTQFAVPVCVEWANNEAGGCVREVSKKLSTPINYTKEIPTGESSFETISMSIPLDYDIVFGTLSEAGITPVYTEQYSIPACL